MSDPRYDALRASKLAAELTDEQCRALAEAVKLQDLNEGDVLVREGTTNSHLYVIVSGVLGVVKNAGTPDAMTLHTLSAGDFVDELGFMDDTALLRVQGRAGPGTGDRPGPLAARSAPGNTSGNRLPRDACDRARHPPDPAPPVDAAERTVELHLQAARALLNAQAEPPRATAVEAHQPARVVAPSRSVPLCDSRPRSRLRMTKKSPAEAGLVVSTRNAGFTWSIRPSPGSRRGGRAAGRRSFPSGSSGCRRDR